MAKRRLRISGNIFTPFKDWSMTSKLLVMVLVPFILTLVTLLYLTLTSLSDLETTTTAEAARQEVGVFQQQFAEMEANLVLTVGELAANPLLLEAVRQNDKQAVQGLLLSASIRSNLDHVEVIDTTGRPLAVVRNFNLSETSPELKRLHDLGLLQITDALQLVPTPSGWLIATVRPLKLSSGQGVGAVSMGRLLDNTALSTLNFERSDLTLLVFDAEGNVINISQKKNDAEAKSEGNLAETIEVNRNFWARAAGGETIFDQVPGKAQWVAYAPLVVRDQISAVFGVVLSTAETTKLRNDLTLTTLGIAGILGLLTLLAAFFLARNFVIRPITVLVAGAEQVAAGQLEVEVRGITNRDEIGMLAASFNKMTAQLRQTLTGLENRTQSLEIVSDFSDRLVAILNLEELLVEIVNQLKERFGYYHVHIYLLDDKQEKLIVAEGTGAAGVEMKAKGHSIPLRAPTSLVARAARTGEIVKVDNVRETEDWLPNPLLPETCSEMAVPIVVDEQVVGVLDVQQNKIAGLDENDVTLLRSLANHVAIAIRNARQFAQVEAALVEAHALQAHYIVQSWDRKKVATKGPGRVQFSLGESTTLNEEIIVQGRQVALASEEPTLATFNSSTDETMTGQSASTLHALVAPIKLHNVPIGDLQFYDINPDRQWTDGELALIYAVIDQVAQVAENLRLLDETQERASREQLISQISNKMRRASDIESLMQIAVTELSRVLEPARTFVHMGLKTEAMPVERNATNGKNGSDQPT